jgi:phosphoglycolate phosphatase-like HAD superfamily hydrolase
MLFSATHRVAHIGERSELMLYLFDIDGTLVSGDGAGRRAFERACLEVLGVAGALADIRLDGMTDPLILDHVFTTRLSRESQASEREAVFARYLEHLEPEVARSEYRVHDGVAEVLDLLGARGATLGLATGNLREGARIKLTRGDLWRRFTIGGFGSDSSDRGELVRIAMERARDRDAFVIGDTPRDVAGAHAAGAKAIAVATGRFSVDELSAAGADAAFPSLREWLAEL